MKSGVVGHSEFTQIFSDHIEFDLDWLVLYSELANK